MSTAHPAGWALMKRHRIPDINDQTRTYLDRLTLIECPWGKIMIHRIMMTDGDRHLHNHPWSFWSVLLRGSYTEQTATRRPSAGPGEPDTDWRRVTRINRKHWGTDYHAIRSLSRAPVWTLVITGPRRCDWDYWTADGPEPWDTYHDARGLTGNHVRT